MEDFSVEVVTSKLKKFLDQTGNRRILGEAKASVLVPIFDISGNTHILLTRRSQKMKKHTGQISFPGGKIDMGETVYEAAIREANEEIGLAEDDIRIIGLLDDFSTSHYHVVSPVLSIINPEHTFVKSPDELDEIIQVPLSDLMDPSIHEIRDWEYKGKIYRVHYYDWVNNGQSYNIWGATAGVINRIIEILRSN